MDQMNKLLLVLLLVLASLAVAEQNTSQSAPTPGSQEEKHLHNIRQLTFGGQNAEAYFSADGKKLIFQSTRDNLKCDQIFTMNLDGSDVRMLSNGKGRTTCAYFYPNGKKILYSSTYLGGAGRGGFGPNARAVSRWGRVVRERARWRASSVTPCSL